jgi:integrase
MPKAKLIKSVVDGAKHEGKGNQIFYRDAELPGFALRVTAGGVKSYVVEYKRAGRNHRVTIGKHGADYYDEATDEVLPLTPHNARKIARRWLAFAGAGEDPAERRRRRREGDTLADVASRYLDDLKARAEAGARRGRLSGWETACGIWGRHVPAAVKRRRVAEITTKDVRRLHKGLGDAGKAPTADRLRTTLHAIFEHAITEGLIATNPAAAVKRYNKPSKRRRALTLDELAALGKVLAEMESTGKITVTDENGKAKEHHMSRAPALALRLLALTGMRKSELLGHHVTARRGPREGLRWADVDVDQGTYTLAAHGGGSGSKGGAVRTLPLGLATVKLLASGRPDDVDPEAPVVASPVDASKPYQALNVARRKIYRAAGIEDADAHCLRHTFESIAFSISPGLAGALTGRALTRDATLNAYLHVDTAALRDVADKVAGRIADAMAGKLADVVPIERRRA